MVSKNQSLKRVEELWLSVPRWVQTSP